MSGRIEKDSRFLLAERYIQETGISVFLTGKAGTGKTTFLKHIVAGCSKRLAVVAPTGVAAVNAGASPSTPSSSSPSAHISLMSKSL